VKSDDIELFDSTAYYPYFSQNMKTIDYNNDKQDDLLVGHLLRVFNKIDSTSIDVDSSVETLKDGLVYFMPYSVDVGNVYCTDATLGAKDIAGILAYFDSTNGGTILGGNWAGC
jgi:hypothetical protein